MHVQFTLRKFSYMVCQQITEQTVKALMWILTLGNQSPTYTKLWPTIYNNCLKNFSHSLHQNIPPEYTVVLTTWLSNLTVLSVHNDARTCHFDGPDMFIDRDIYFWETNKGFWARDLLLHEIHGVLLFVQIVLRNALTVLQISILIWEMYQSEWEKL